MKKIFCVILAFFLLTTTFTGCNTAFNGNSNTEPEEADVQAEESFIPPTLKLDIESVYADTINAYIEIVINHEFVPDIYDCVTYPKGMDKEIGTDLLEMALTKGDTVDGYCIQDINGDGIEELIFLDRYYNVDALFTYIDGKVKFVKQFDSGAIDKYGNIYDRTFNKYSFFGWQECVQTMDSHGDLTDILFYGSVGDEDKTDNEYYKKVNDKYASATKEEIEEFKKQFRQLWEQPHQYDCLSKLTEEHLTYTPFGDEYVRLTGFSALNSHSSYRSGEIMGDYDALGQPVLYVRPWNEFLTIPKVYGTEEYGVMPFERNFFCAALLNQDTGILFANQAYDSTKIDVIKFTKGNDNYSIKTIDIPLISTEQLGIMELFCSFIDSQTGYLFVFEAILKGYEAQGGEMLSVYKTEDGGETWHYVEAEKPLKHSLADRIIYAEFLNENIGIVSGRYKQAEFLEGRTYITFDGGKTWNSFASLPYPDDGKGLYSTIRSIEFKDDLYKMTVDAVINGGSTASSRRETHIYISEDMRSWELEGAPILENPFSSYATIAHMFRTIAENVMHFDEEKNRNGEYEAMCNAQKDHEKEWYYSIFTAAFANKPADISAYHCETEDINGDYMPELFLKQGDTILAIFTTFEGKPVMLDAFWNRYRGDLLDDGLIYTTGSSGASQTKHCIYRLPQDGQKLELIDEFGTNGVDDKNETVYYQLINGEKVPITKDEFDTLMTKYQSKH